MALRRPSEGEDAQQVREDPKREPEDGEKTGLGTSEVMSAAAAVSAARASRPVPSGVLGWRTGGGARDAGREVLAGAAVASVLRHSYGGARLAVEKLWLRAGISR